MIATKLSLIFLLLFGSVVPTPLFLNDLPQSIADNLGVSVIAAQLLLTLIVVLAAILPVVVLAPTNRIAALITGLAALSFCLAVGWLPAEVFILFILVITFIVAGLFRDMITGRGGGEK